MFHFFMRHPLADVVVGRCSADAVTMSLSVTSLRRHFPVLVSVWRRLSLHDAYMWLLAYTYVRHITLSCWYTKL